jgi:hypothetical protein
LKDLVEDKFVDALRAASVSMTMQEFLDKRQDFIQGVQNAVAEDLKKNGLELESVSLTRFDQTQKQFFNADNAFDAEGLTGLTEATQRRAKERNEIEQHQVAIAQKNFEATQLKLDIEKNQRFATLVQQQEIALREAEQQAQVVSTQAQRKREAEQARIDAERLVKEAEVLRDQAVRQKQIDSDRTLQVATIEQQRTTETGQEKAILVARKTEEQPQAEARATSPAERWPSSWDHRRRGRRGAAQKGGRAGEARARRGSGRRDYRRRRSGKGRGAEPRPRRHHPPPICATMRPRPRAKSGSTRRAARFAALIDRSDQGTVADDPRRRNGSPAEKIASGDHRPRRRLLQPRRRRQWDCNRPGRGPWTGFGSLLAYRPTPRSSTGCLPKQGSTADPTRCKRWSGDASEITAPRSQTGCKRRSMRFTRGTEAPGIGRTNGPPRRFTTDATVHRTFDPKPLETPGEIAAYFHKLTQNPELKATVQFEKIDLFGDAAVASGLDTFSYKKYGQLVELPARYTFVYRKMPHGWTIVRHHSSALPATH